MSHSVRYSCLFASTIALVFAGCIAPAGPGGGSNTPVTAQKDASGNLVAPSAEPAEVYEPTWADASGNEGKGGVRLISKTGMKKVPLRESDFDHNKKGDESSAKRSGWQLFAGPGNKSLSLEWEWITKADDKFFGLKWAGSGVAFNASWTTVDATQAKYLVLYAKTSHPNDDVDLKLALHAAKKTKGEENTGKVSLKDYIEGKKLGSEWRRAVIPISAFGGLEKVDLALLQTVLFDVDGTYPENQRVFVQIDNMFLTDLEMVTPVENLGYALADGTLILLWDKRPGEKVQKFVVRAGSKELLSVPADKREARIPLSAVGQGKQKLSVVVVGTKEESSPQTLTVEASPPPVEQATVTIDAADLHEVSPYILGTNYASPEAMKGAGMTITRWGGNGVSKYNYQNDLSSAGSDWFFLNTYTAAPGAPETEKAYYKYIKDAVTSGADVNFTIPMLDWIAKPHPEAGQARYCSFPSKVFPEQDKTDGQGCGNGMKPGGKEAIWGNDPKLAMMPSSPEFQRGFVEAIKKHFGGAGTKGKGVKFYTLDNEPGLWNHTHRDVKPKGVTAEELADLSEKYALMIKTVDPQAQVIGFASWGMMELAGSNADYTPPGPDGYKRYNKFKPEEEKEKFSEVKKHGGKSQLVYLLERFRDAEKKHGKRLVDAIDVHWYPEIYAKNGKGETRRLSDAADPELASKQFEALREWYDPAFKLENHGMESWTADQWNRPRLWDVYHPVIPALKKLISTTYPGTKLTINEFNSGANDVYTGALLRTALYGIFMQEDLYMSQNWFQVDTKKPMFFAQQLYGNFDGKGSRIRGKFRKSQSSSPDLLTYVTRDAERYYVVLVNKNPKAGIKAQLKLPAAAKELQQYLLSESLGLRLHESPKQAAGDQKVTVPPYSALLVVAK